MGMFSRAVIWRSHFGHLERVHILSPAGIREISTEVKDPNVSPNITKKIAKNGEGNETTVLGINTFIDLRRYSPELKS
jgi:hypothetical protein